MNKLKREMDAFIGSNPRFKESLKQKIRMEIKNVNREEASTKSKSPIKYAAVFVLLLSAISVFLVLNLNKGEPEPQNKNFGQPETAVLTDSSTEAEIAVFTEYDAPMEILNFKYDAMDQGNHEYTVYPLLIDPQAYEDKSVSRGDVIVYEMEAFDGKKKTVSRIIGLPGETIEIKEGQVYVIGQQLNTFYGKAHRMGIGSLEEYDAALKAQGAEQNVGSMKEIFSQTTAAFRLAKDEVFVAGDDWFRGSQETLLLSEIEGEVMGYIK
ncbi:S26 family signal peptidase [Planococcus sp. N064]|uniref:S26 family signal peptidase n=1 Tax=Planococcus liqunii TaxID=3058394 RepID=A0ABT8MTX2_9BACL|nr:S26 family signal peptidase [Planococcus sp. N064]MDN7228238.1 S26 family signal peptidase [Planococcus sp. N064]